jgi:uncharacterized protein YndB with AHSA1/START domain
MSVDVIVDIVIDRSPAEVFGYAGDPSNAPEWYRRINSADWETEPLVELGSRITFEAKFMGKALNYTYEIVELVADERMVMTTAEGPFPMTTTYTWEPSGATGTTMTLRNSGEPTGFSKFGAPMMSMAMKRAMTQDLKTLKSILESR